MVKSEFDDCFQNGNYDALRPYHVDNAIILAAGMCPGLNLCLIRSLKLF